MNPPTPSLLSFALVVGAAFGAIEAAVRLAPRAGMTGAEIATFVGLAILVSVGTAVLLALVARAVRPLPWLGQRPFGLVLAGIIGLQSSANYRFELVLNLYARDPRVWGGLLVCLGLSLALGLLLDGVARRPFVLRLGVALTLVGAVAAFGRGRPIQGKPGSRPSILVISMDTVRHDHVSPSGHSINTPNIQRLADEGVQFSQTVAAAPVTEPSHLAMFTGIAPYRSGVLANGTRLGERPALIAHTLRENGWLTAGFVSGFPLHSKYDWAQGMDVWDDDFGALAGFESLSWVKAYNQVALKDHALRERSASRVLARVLPWLRSHRDQQFYAFVHFYDAHGPYESPGNALLGEPPRQGPPLLLPGYWPPYYRGITDPDWLIRSYDAEIEHVDQAIGQLLDALGSRLDQTVVMVTADHGESLTEHDYAFDHGDHLYDPELLVPWIVRHPASARAGLTVDCQVGGVDLAPTVLELAGITDPHGRDGVSRAPELRGGGCRDRPVVSSTVSGRATDPPPVDHALRDKGWKYIQRAVGAPLVFDLRNDPGELHPVADNPVGALLGPALAEWIQTGAPAKLPEVDAETRQALEALGYIE